MSPTPSPERLRALAPDVVRFFGEPRSGRFWDWLLREYKEHRVIVDVAVERVTSWPDPAAAGARTVVGAPWPAQPPSQSPPAGGTGPRVDLPALTTALAGLPHRLLAYRGADGFPVITPVQLGACGPGGLRLVTPAGVLPRGARRAGLLAHRFGPQCSPLMMLTGTGWLDTEGETVRYAPHTLEKLGTPPTKFLQSLGNGALAKYGYHRARRTGQLHRLETLAAQADPGDDAPTRPRVGPVQSGQEPEPS